VPDWASGALVVGAFAALLVLERRRPLRSAVEPTLRRDLRNLAVAAVGAVALQVLENPAVNRLAAEVQRRRWGLLQLVRLPVWAETALAYVLMDYTLYVWHVLTHRVSWLWRFHLVHHVDLDLSASTALRFHFAELALSVPWRCAQVLLLGIRPGPLKVWQTALFLSILFHHSNLRLPRRLERRLVRFIVTPRMHGIHHSAVREETDSNWSSGLTVWDRLHGTLRLGVPQGAITIGVPAYRDARELTAGRLLALPFGPERPAWRAAVPHPAPGETAGEVRHQTR
jgi:sterol desaturase/sphingolipid hydroxylase (fatty acid hydroxylase superfamily)